MATPTIPTSVANCLLALLPNTGLFTDAGKTTPCAASGDLVAVWADQTVNGNDVSQTTSGTRPSFQLLGLNNHPSVRFGGSQNLTMASGAMAGLLTSSYTLIVTLRATSITAASYGCYFGKKAAAADSRFFHLLSNNVGGKSAIVRYNGIAAIPPNTGAPTPTVAQVEVPMCITYRYDSVAGTEEYSVNGVGALTRTGSVASADATALWMIGGAVAGFPFTGDISSLCLYNRVLTDSELSGIEAWCMGQSAILPAPATVEIEHCGDSLTFGQNTTATNSYPEQLLRLLGPGYGLARNYGISGQTLITATHGSTHGIMVDEPVIPVARGNTKIAIVWGGTNDLAVYSSTVADTYAALIAYCALWKSAGYKVLVLTTIYRGSLSEVTRGQYNAMIIGGDPSYDAVCDVGSDPLLGTLAGNTNLLVFNGDRTHLTDYGQSLVAGRVATSVLAIVSPVAPSGPARIHY